MRALNILGAGLIGALAVAAAGPALALPDTHEYWIYYTDASHSTQTGTFLIACTGKITRTGYETEHAVLHISTPCFVFPEPGDGDWGWVNP
ncbi:hypothetical protein D3C86_1253670 [compost metagenome]